MLASSASAPSTPASGAPAASVVPAPGVFAPSLERYVSGGVTLLGDRSRPGGVTLAFTERTGGVSKGPYASLNLSARCGDDPADVAKNRARALAAIGAGADASRLIEPRQVHGERVVCLSSSSSEGVAAARAQAQAGADAVVCAAVGVPVMLCFADCVPVILVAGGAFAVVHSGWRGTLARISARAARSLAKVAGCAPAELLAYVGPHIQGGDYEVSDELLGRFEEAFGADARVAGHPGCLNLTACVIAALAEAGLEASRIAVCEDSTASNTGRFFSYRAEGGRTGRHAAIAYIGDGGQDGRS